LPRSAATRDPRSNTSVGWQRSEHHWLRVGLVVVARPVASDVVVEIIKAR